MTADKENIYAISWPKEGVSGQTGTWRFYKPVIDKEKCINCEICWGYCSEAAIGRDISIRYEYCKGCGVCAAECPKHAIAMVREE